MNPLALIWNNYLRWRHSKGFGVHSPFAYNLVTTVVRPGIYGYYGYDDIESAIYEETDNPDGDPALENDAQLASEAGSLPEDGKTCADALRQ